MIRKLLTVLVVVSLLVTAVPTTALAQTDPVEAVDAAEEANIVQYAEGPSYVVEFDNDSAGDLEEWANQSGRQLVDVDNETATAVVAGEPDEIVASGFFAALLSNPLSERSFVESAAPNYAVSLDPRTSGQLMNVSEFAAPEAASEDWFSLSSEPMPHDGMAFSSDANRTTMAESRAALGADNVSATGAGETIAVLDTGANTADGRVFGEDGQPGSELRILPESKNVLTNETVAEHGLDAIEDGSSSTHGTWTAAAAAGDANGTTHDGVAPDADLLVVKTLGDDGSGDTAAIARGIRYAAQEGASVISMSLGSPVYSEAIETAIADAREKGAVVVTAAGNSRQSVRWVASPADTEETIAVGATTGEEPAEAESAYFSQVGPDPGTLDGSSGATTGAGVDVAAPGMATVAPVPTTSGVVDEVELSGTSMATPMVSGGVAVALAANDWSAEEATQRVREATRPVPNAGVTEVGNGMHATDYLVDGETPETTQEDARTDGAYTRDLTYQSLSDSSGGFLAGLLG